MNTKSPIIAIVLPAYNESKTIGSIIKSFPENIKIGKIAYSVKLVVVNDGSSDNTAEIVARLKKAYLINHILNCGAGAATRTGLTYAKKLNCIAAITMDADGQHTLEDTIKVMGSVVNDEGDLVIGNRLMEKNGMPWYRVLGNKCLSLITFLLFGVFVTDSQSGLRAFNKLALDKISFQSNNFAFCSEVIWRAKQKKLRIKEVPIQAIYTDYSLSKGQSNWGAVQIIQQLIKRRILEFIDG